MFLIQKKIQIFSFSNENIFINNKKSLYYGGTWKKLINDLKDKIRLITSDYSEKLQEFDKDSIDNALEFLQRRRQNNGKIMMISN